MKLNQRANRQSGLTAIEVLIVVVTLCLLAFLLLALPVPRASSKAPLTACGSQLKQVALAQIVWANDNESTIFLAQVSTNARGFRELLSPTTLPHYFQSLSNELVSPRILTCPSDTRKPANDFESLTTNHLSYFLNMDARPVAVTSTVPDAETSNVLHGDRHITFSPAARGQIVTLTTNLSLRWTRKKGHGIIGNIALADGSVMKATDRDLAEYLLAPSRVSVQRLLFP